MDCLYGGCIHNDFGTCLINDKDCPFILSEKGDDIMPKSPKCPVCGNQYTFWYRYINGKEVLVCGNELCKYHEETTVQEYKKMIEEDDEQKGV